MARRRHDASASEESPWGAAVEQQLALRGMSRLELARQAGIDAGTVTHVVRGGHCSTVTLQKIARALDVELAELFLPPGASVEAADMQDRLVAAVLRELSQEVGEALTQRVYRRRDNGRMRGEVPLPFGE